MVQREVKYIAHMAWTIRLVLDKEHFTNEEQLEVAKHLMKQIEEDTKDEPNSS